MQTSQKCSQKPLRIDTKDHNSFRKRRNMRKEDKNWGADTARAQMPTQPLRSAARARNASRSTLLDKESPIRLALSCSSVGSVCLGRPVQPAGRGSAKYAPMASDGGESAGSRRTCPKSLQLALKMIMPRGTAPVRS